MLMMLLTALLNCRPVFSLEASAEFQRAANLEAKAEAASLHLPPRNRLEVERVEEAEEAYVRAGLDSRRAGFCVAATLSFKKFSALEQRARRIGQEYFDGNHKFLRAHYQEAFQAYSHAPEYVYLPGHAVGFQQAEMGEFDLAMQLISRRIVEPSELDDRPFLLGILDCATGKHRDAERNFVAAIESGFDVPSPEEGLAESSASAAIFLASGNDVHGIYECPKMARMLPR